MVIMVTNTRLSLRLDSRIIAELKQKALAEGKSISQFITDAKGYFDFDLNESISLRVDYIQPVALGSEIYRIDIFFKESHSERILRPLWYELWVLQDCVEDELHTPQNPKSIDFAEYAFRFISKRYKENENTLPSEYGAFMISDRTLKLTNNRAELWEWYDVATKGKSK